jgi:hypothetical protein
MQECELVGINSIPAVISKTHGFDWKGQSNSNYFFQKQQRKGKQGK